jgi:chromosomal replication initiator protein
MADNYWDYSIFWKETVKQLRNELSEQEYVMWFNNLSYSGSRENEIELAVPSSFYRDQVVQRYLPAIETLLFELSGNKIKVCFAVKANVNAKPEKHVAPESREEKTIKPAQEDFQNGKKNHPQLKEDYTFSNFIIGDNSSFAANAAVAIAKNPGKAYNPCLIYGGVGLGKTHLIQAIGNYVHNANENLKIVYTTAESFTNEFINSINTNTSAKFKNKYRFVDILLIDDIHFLQNKTGSQEELFYTFKSLYEANKQIVLTCDRPIDELKDIADRLKSRFKSGLNVDLTPPDYETRYAILKRKVEQKGTNIPDDVIELISKNIASNVRDLEAALTKLIAYSELVNKNISVETAKQQLRDIFYNPKQNNITIDLIQKSVAEYYNLSLNDFKGKKRTKAIVLPRQISMFIAREITEYSLTELGYEYGGRDHTTVMHACQKVEERMKVDPSLDTIINNLIKTIKEQASK